MRNYQREKNEFLMCWLVAFIMAILILGVHFLVNKDEPMKRIFFYNHSKIR